MRQKKRPIKSKREDMPMNRLIKVFFTTVINFIVFDYYSWQSMKIFHSKNKEYLEINKNIPQKSKKERLKKGGNHAPA